MNYKISFQERAKQAQAILSKQLPTTLTQAKAQVEKLKKDSTQKSKKQKSY
jgi:hypothetical protein